MVTPFFKRFLNATISEKVANSSKIICTGCGVKAYLQGCLVYAEIHSVSPAMTNIARRSQPDSIAYGVWQEHGPYAMLCTI